MNAQIHRQSDDQNCYLSLHGDSNDSHSNNGAPVFPPLPVAAILV